MSAAADADTDARPAANAGGAVDAREQQGGAAKEE
jgi:hypothetical protein